MKRNIRIMKVFSCCFFALALFSLTGITSKTVLGEGSLVKVLNSDPIVFFTSDEVKIDFESSEPNSYKPWRYNNS